MLPTLRRKTSLCLLLAIRVQCPTHSVLQFVSQCYTNCIVLIIHFHLHGVSANNFFFLSTIFVSNIHETLSQCRFIVGPSSPTLSQHFNNIGSTSRACWVCTVLPNMMSINILRLFRDQCLRLYRWHLR